LFTATIDYQLNKLNSRFKEQATELLILSAALNRNRNDAFKSFNVDDIFNLVENFYPSKFFYLRKNSIGI